MMTDSTSFLLCLLTAINIAWSYEVVATSGSEQKGTTEYMFED